MTVTFDNSTRSESAKRSRRTLKIAAGWVIAGVCAVLIGHEALQQREAIRGLRWQFGWRSAAAIGCIMLAQVAVGTVIHTYLRALRCSARWPRVLAVYLISQASKYLPIGGVLNIATQTVGLSRLPGVGALQGFFAILLGLATICASGITWFGMTALLDADKPWWLAAVCISALPLTLVTLLNPRVSAALSVRLVTRITPGEPGSAHVESPSGIRLLLAPLFGLLAWGMFGISLVLIASEITPLTAGTAFQLTGTMAAAWVVGFASFIVPAGLGVRDGALMLLLQPLVAAPGPIVIPIVSRLLWTVADLLNFLIAAVCARRGLRSAPSSAYPGTMSPAKGSSQNDRSQGNTRGDARGRG